jgi:AraC-like DNA-binding protein
MKITIEDKVYYAKKNDCILLRPNVYHKIEWDGVDCEQPHVHFDFYYQENSPEVQVSMIKKDQMSEKELGYFREDFYKKHNLNIPYVFQLKEPSLVRTLLFRLIDEYTYKLPYSDLMIQGTLSELIAVILRDFHLGEVKSYSPYYKDLNELVIFMVENVDDNLSLDKLTSKTQFSKWNLIQTFKKYYGTTPVKYQNRLRYNRAKNLLQYTNLSIKEITYKMNFVSPQAFSRWFKMMDGKAPGIYQNKSR